MQESFLGRAQRTGCAQQDDDVASLKAGFRRRLRGPDMASANGCHLDAEFIHRQLAERTPDRVCAVDEQNRMQARLVAVLVPNGGRA